MNHVKRILSHNTLKKVQNIGLALAAGFVAAGTYGYQVDMEQRLSNKQQIIEEIQQQNDVLQASDQAAKELTVENRRLQEEVKRLQIEVSRQAERTFEVNVTAYDLSIQSCGKGASDPGYGITATGISLAGKSREEARVIAVDPAQIPLGSKVRLRFDNPDMQEYNGIYIAADTGSAINGNRIDLFMGDGSYSEAMAFGSQYAKVTIL